MSSSNLVRYWSHPAVAGVDLMRARFRRHEFRRHSHETFAIGLIETGPEDLGFGTGSDIAASGGVVLINPGEVHAGRAAADNEWSYRVFYPDPELITALAKELTVGGPPAFREQIVYAPQMFADLRAAHQAADKCDDLASSYLLQVTLGRLLTRYGEPARRRLTAFASRQYVDRATAVLHERMMSPPTLDELAALVGTGKFALLRAFHTVHGVPPYVYLNQLRVRHVQRMLERGVGLADAAAAAGFTDQPHMSRNFRAIIGVAPGAYRRECEERRNYVQDLTARGSLRSRNEFPT
ncbi:AraC family transcriptional regulator [Asanoa siamensis]|uniref:AraC family transcriptional regulator n=1 Tax=Asanoa siamensis TaxID=926357 RepID=A0ABQ4CY46_9ACTN|nr:AraC family transcriptional regulator [Asanoa siamensis]GIF76218.1 AraC family transcriptional regulator [Asanoa siamensis]